MIASHHAGTATVLLPNVCHDLRLLEKAIVWLTFEKTLEIDDARRLRGAIAARMRHIEFHQHTGSALIYHSPRIRYDTSDGIAKVIGIGDGSLMLRALPRFETLRLGNREHAIDEQACEPFRCEVGPTQDSHEYRFRSPYLPLNQENFGRWQQAGSEERDEILRRVVVGNLLAFAKGIGMSVSERLHAEIDLEPGGWHTLKPGVRLLSFTGTIRINFLIPDMWGLGKSIARGFGTLTRVED